MNGSFAMVVHGTSRTGAPPGLEALAREVELRFSTDAAGLRAALPGAEALLVVDFRAGDLAQAWDAGDALRWIHFCGAGVDATLFPALVESDVVLTNARGVFDEAMAEYVLGLVIAFAKGLPETLAAQRERRWSYRVTERIAGTRALVVGVGSIGRAIARALGAAGVRVSGVGRRARAGDADLEAVHARADLDRVLGEADWVVAVMPRTPDTEDVFGAAQFAAMRASARFVNVGRGNCVDEAALVAALHAGTIAGAALDVFRTEPLPPESPLWDAPNLVVSPHMSGDFIGHREALMAGFLENLRRYRAGEPLANVVDKRLGFVTGDDAGR